MSVIAVAGGTGGVGKTIVERLAEESKFQVIVLTRSVGCHSDGLDEALKLTFSRISKVIPFNRYRSTTMTFLQ